MDNRRPLVANNDFNRYVRIEYVTAQGVIAPLTDGTVIGMLATTSGPNASAADVALEASLTYIGGANGLPAGTWLFQLDANVLTDEVLDPLFAGIGSAYFIVRSTNNIRRWEKVPYYSHYPAETIP